jgi:hypothetical protein
MSEIQNYFASYIILNLLINGLRLIVNKIKSRKILKEKSIREKKFEKFYSNKTSKFKRIQTLNRSKTTLNQSKPQFQSTIMDFDKREKLEYGQTSLTNFQTNDEESRKLQISGNVESLKDFPSSINQLSSENATELNQPNQNPIEKFKKDNRKPIRN